MRLYTATSEKRRLRAFFIVALAIIVVLSGRLIWLQILTGQALKVKAAGGIRSAKYAQELIEAGADRLGTSAGILIVNSWNE